MKINIKTLILLRMMIVYMMSILYNLCKQIYISGAKIIRVNA
jgi:hypothetical protein